MYMFLLQAGYNKRHCLLNMLSFMVSRITLGFPKKYCDYTFVRIRRSPSFRNPFIQQGSHNQEIQLFTSIIYQFIVNPFVFLYITQIIHSHTGPCVMQFVAGLVGGQSFLPQLYITLWGEAKASTMSSAETNMDLTSALLFRGKVIYRTSFFGEGGHSLV